MSESLIRYSCDGDIALLMMAAPEQNTLSEDLIEALHDALVRFEMDNTCRAAILYGAEGVFSKGAHPRQLGSLYNSDAARLPVDVLNRLDKPVLALMSGPVYGGALEIALACHERLATADATLSFPEIHLGLPPGAGATQHLPRLIDTAMALSMLTDGIAINAQQALECELVSAVVNRDDMPEVLQFARTLTNAAYPTRPVWTRDFRNPSQIRNVIAAHRDGTEMRSGEGFEAILACVEAAATMAYRDAYQLELDAYQGCEVSPVRVALNNLKMCRTGAQWRSPAANKDLALSVDCVTVVAQSLRPGVALPSGDRARLVAGLHPFTSVTARFGGVAVFILDYPEPASVMSVARMAGPSDVIAYIGSADDFTRALAGLDTAARWVFVHTCGGRPKTIFQPVLRDDLEADVLPTLVKAARSIGFVVIHSDAAAPLGQLLLDECRMVTKATENAGEFVSTASVGQHFEDFFKIDDKTGIFLPESEPASSASAVEKKQFLLACALTNAGCHLLDRKQALHPEDIDLVTGLGYGFAVPFYGPMLWALKIGLPKIFACLAEAEKRFGEPFKPAELLRRHGGV